jgi:hypothetical protein
VMKRWGEQSNDYAELGAVLNGFSLTEKGDLAVAIERTGQAVDATYLSTTHLVRPFLLAYRLETKASSKYSFLPSASHLLLFSLSLPKLLLFYPFLVSFNNGKPTSPNPSPTTSPLAKSFANFSSTATRNTSNTR